jgi:hypothetical protein
MLLRNYYQTAVRQISRNRFHTGINVIGRVAECCGTATANPVKGLRSE